MPLCFFSVTVTISGSFLIGYEESRERTVELELEKNKTQESQALSRGWFCNRLARAEEDEEEEVEEEEEEAGQGAEQQLFLRARPDHKEKQRLLEPSQE